MVAVFIFIYFSAMYFLSKTFMIQILFCNTFNFNFCHTHVVCPCYQDNVSRNVATNTCKLPVRQISTHTVPPPRVSSPTTTPTLTHLWYTHTYVFTVFFTGIVFFCNIHTAHLKFIEMRMLTTSAKFGININQSYPVFTTSLMLMFVWS